MKILYNVLGGYFLTHTVGLGLNVTHILTPSQYTFCVYCLSNTNCILLRIFL